MEDAEAGYVESMMKQAIMNGHQLNVGVTVEDCVDNPPTFTYYTPDECRRGLIKPRAYITIYEGRLTVSSESGNHGVIPFVERVQPVIASQNAYL